MLGDVKRDCAHAGVASPTVALADFSEVHHAVGIGPGIRADGHLHAKSAFAESDAVHALRMQIVGDKFVVALEWVVRDVEEDSSLLAFRALFQDSDRAVMPFQKRRQ